MILLNVLFLVAFISKISSSSGDSGPFKVVVLNITTQCNRTSKPFEKVPTVMSDFWAYNTTNNTSLVDGNVTLLKDLKNLMGSIKLYYEEDGKRKIFQIIDKVDCKTFLLSTVMKLWGHKSWKDYCTIPKGTYHYSMDYNKAFHLWKKEIQLGIMLVKLEIVKGSETVFCLDNRLLLAPDPPRSIILTKRKKSNFPSSLVSL